MYEDEEERMSIGMAGRTIRMSYDIGNCRRYIDMRKVMREFRFDEMKIPPNYDAV